MKVKLLKIKNINSNLLIIIIDLIIFSILFLDYIFILHKYFFIKENFLLDFEPYKIITLIVSLSFVGFNFLIKSSFVKAVWNIIFLYNLCGSLIYYFFNDANISIVFQNLILLMFILLADKININLKFKTLDIYSSYKILFVVSLVLFIPFLQYLKYLKLENLLFVNVYETRLQFRELSTSLTGYLESPLCRIFLPIVLIVSIQKKKYLLALVSSVIIFYIFLCSATKSILVGFFITILFYFGKNYIDKIKIFSLFIFSLTLISILFLIFFNNPDFFDVSIRRVFFVPAKLDNSYHEYFNHNFTLYSHSPLSLGLIENKFGDSLSLYFGEEILGKENMNANVGIITEGFISLGYFGVVLTSAIYSFFVLILKSIKMQHIFFGIVYIYIYNLNTSFLSTLLLTHGLFLFLIVSILFLKTEDEDFTHS